YWYGPSPPPGMRPATAIRAGTEAFRSRPNSVLSPQCTQSTGPCADKLTSEPAGTTVYVPDKMAARAGAGSKAPKPAASKQPRAIIVRTNFINYDNRGSLLLSNAPVSSN